MKFYTRKRMLPLACKKEEFWLSGMVQVSSVAGRRCLGEVGGSRLQSASASTFSSPGGGRTRALSTVLRYQIKAAAVGYGNL